MAFITFLTPNWCGHLLQFKKRFQLQKGITFPDHGTIIWAQLLQKKLVTNIPPSLKGFCLPEVLSKENSRIIVSVERGGDVMKDGR